MSGSKPHSDHLFSVCMNYAWTIICNVSEGDWTKQNQEWQDAAARCREQYHALLAENEART